MKTLWRHRAALLLCIALTGAAAGLGIAHARNQVVADDPEVRKLVQDQLELAQRALGLIDRSAKIGAPVANAAMDVHAWSHRRLAAKLYLTFDPGERKTMDPEVYLMHADGAANPERIAAFEEHSDLMKSWQARYRGLAQSGVGSQFDYFKLQSHYLQAEIWLARERNRKPGADKP